MTKIDVQDEVKRWRNEEIISDYQADRILDLYKNEKSKDIKIKDKLSNLIYIIAGLCMCLGIITIISFNWSMFDVEIRTFIGLLPLIFSSALCVFALVKNTSDGFNNFVVTVNIGAVMASIALIGQIFHINGSMFSYSITVAILILPMMYIFKSPISIFAFTILTTVAICSKESDVFTADLILLGLTLISFALTLYFSKNNKTKHHINKVIYSLVQILLCLNTILFVLIPIVENLVNDEINIVICALIYIRVYEFILELIYKKLDIDFGTELFKLASNIIIIIYVWIGFSFDSTIDFNVIIFLLMIFGIFISHCKLKDKLITNTEIFYIMACIFQILCWTVPFFVSDITIVLTLIWYLIIAIKYKDYSIGIKVFNVSIVYILIKFFISDSNLMVKAIVLIVVAIVMLIANKILKGRKAELISDEDKYEK